MSQSSGAYDPSIRKELDKVDWDDVLPRVFKYARWRAKKFEWLGEPVDPEALVREAIVRAYGVGTGGTFRNWKKETCPDIADFLIGIIRSITSHKAENEASFPVESLCKENGSPKDNKLFRSADETAGVSKPKNPEEELIEAENLQNLMDELDSLENEDEDLGMVILSIKDGNSKPRHIAQDTGYEVKDVNNILKRLRRKLKHLKPKSRKQSSMERREEWA